MITRTEINELHSTNNRTKHKHRNRLRYNSSHKMETENDVDIVYVLTLFHFPINNQSFVLNYFLYTQAKYVMLLQKFLLRLH